MIAAGIAILFAVVSTISAGCWGIAAEAREPAFVKHIFRAAAVLFQALALLAAWVAGR